MVEMPLFTMSVVLLSQSYGETFLLYKESGVVHLCLEKGWVVPLPLIGHKMSRAACPQSVALAGMDNRPAENEDKQDKGAPEGTLVSVKYSRFI